MAAMTGRVLIALAFLLGAVGCHADAFIPEGTARITPPASYRQWWEASRSCVNKPEWRHFEDIAWYWSPEPLISGEGVEAVGLTIENRVYIQVLYANVPWIVQHELVHAINGLHGHPPDPFQRCHLLTWQGEHL